jgi:hypothetical protein
MRNGFDGVVTGGSLVSRAIAPGCNSSPRGNSTDPSGRHRASTPYEGISAWFGCKSKGYGRPARADRTRRSADLWANLAETFHETPGTKVAPDQAADLAFRVREADLARRALVERIQNESDNAVTRMPRHCEVRAMAPDLAPQWSGPPAARETSTLIIYIYSVYLR